ncbi:hypothetical protein HYH03_016222 [Edaphochlamys debaryana]|uniref:Arp2/3 complex 41 kDa subunit n=1 Tax=Edaphochlamys debaryana TaxID=47281 RepID=A0A836BRN3_9CHLO|nr:hypothetical protein HYH03_016222 [Edaphochlamys debaryana]|eukprot:KAG2485019.1 hypothetical protein HYH03_016222 [Edaphochlamys debaryana]
MASAPLPVVTRTGSPIQAIAFNGDCSSIAVSHSDSNDVHVYQLSAGATGPPSWTKVASLDGHHMLVSGLDWSPRGDQILSCSHDRNAFVWTRARPDGALTSGRAAAAAAGSGAGGGGGAGAGAGAGAGGWEKQMVITRLTKGALCVKWSPSEAKFAIGSAAKVVSVGYFDPEAKWWACRVIRKAHESSVVAVAWHPNSVILATGSTDRRVRLFNAYVAGYEPEAPAGTLPPGSAFGECILEVAHPECGWVHALSWSHGGDQALLYASHDSVLGTVRGPQATVAVSLPGLPLKQLASVSERVAVGAGWEGALLVFTRRSAQDAWQLTATLGGGGGGSGSGGSAAAGGTASTVKQLAAMHLGGAGGGAAGSGGGGGTAGHSALVTGLHARGAATAAGRPRWHVASAGLDGAILLWDLSPFL